MNFDAKSMIRTTNRWISMKSKWFVQRNNEFQRKVYVSYYETMNFDEKSMIRTTKRWISMKSQWFVQRNNDFRWKVNWFVQRNDEFRWKVNDSYNESMNFDEKSMIRTTEPWILMKWPVEPCRAVPASRHGPLARPRTGPQLRVLLSFGLSSIGLCRTILQTPTRDNWFYNTYPTFHNNHPCD